jgi:hypothetical protein
MPCIRSTKRSEIQFHHLFDFGIRNSERHRQFHHDQGQAAEENVRSPAK